MRRFYRKFQTESKEPLRNFLAQFVQKLEPFFVFLRKTRVITEKVGMSRRPKIRFGFKFGFKFFCLKNSISFKLFNGF